MWGRAIQRRCVSYDVRMTCLRIVILMLALGALSACGDDDFNTDASVIDQSASADDGGTG
jgi:hypothetical protein